MKQVQKYIPITAWLSAYKKQYLKGDLIAGITVGVMLIPQGMAYSMLAGLPPIYGLYASIIPLLIYAFLGTSRQLAVGPVAMVSLLAASGVGAIAGSQLDTFISLSIALSMIVGIVLVLMGLFRLGFLVNFLSHPVLSGFTSAAALIIGMSQLKHLLGIDIARSHHIHEIVLDVVKHISEINMATLGIGMGAILLIWMTRRFKLPIPGPLIAVVFGILAVWFTGWHEVGVKIVGTVPSGLPSFSLPRLDWKSIQQLFPIALTIAVVGYMESIAVAKSIQMRRKNYQLDSNQELVALGMANIGGALFQSFPVAGGFSRTAVNEQSGANTGLASIISALLIALTLLFLTPLFYYLPQAILASVIIVAVIGLIDIKEAVYLWKTNRRDFGILIITFLATLTIGIEGGILIGVILSLMLIIYNTSQPHIAELAKIPNSNIYRNIERFDHLEKRADLFIFRFDTSLYFANINALKDYLQAKTNEEHSTLKAIIFDAECINRIDSSGIHTLEEIYEAYQSRGISFFITSVKGPVRDILHRTGSVEKIGKDNFFITIQDAVNYFDLKHKDDKYDRYIIQSNKITN